MTSGRRPCTDCGRNSPQGRHASCHVLTVLRAAWETNWPIVRADRLSGDAFGVHDQEPYHRRLYSAVRLLRQQGHDISTIGGGVFGCSYRLNAPAPSPEEDRLDRARGSDLGQSPSTEEANVQGRGKARQAIPSAGAGRNLNVRATACAPASAPDTQTP